MRHRLPKDWNLLPMREKIEQMVITGFRNGLDELGYTCYTRDIHPIDPDTYKVNPDFSIYEFVKMCSDKELLDAMDSQACQQYR